MANFELKWIWPFAETEMSVRVLVGATVHAKAKLWFWRRFRLVHFLSAIIYLIFEPQVRKAV